MHGIFLLLAASICHRTEEKSVRFGNHNRSLQINLEAANANAMYVYVSVGRWLCCVLLAAGACHNAQHCDLGLGPCHSGSRLCAAHVNYNLFGAVLAEQLGQTLFQNLLVDPALQTANYQINSALHRAKLRCWQAVAVLSAFTSHTHTHRVVAQLWPLLQVCMRARQACRCRTPPHIACLLIHPILLHMAGLATAHTFRRLLSRAPLELHS